MEKVLVVLNGIPTGKGYKVHGDISFIAGRPFRIKKGNVAVRITKPLHLIARKGIWQFNEKNVKTL
jgi:hypothetical protein